MSWLGGVLGAVGGFITGGPVGAVAGAIGGFSSGGGTQPAPQALPGGARGVTSYSGGMVNLATPTSSGLPTQAGTAAAVMTASGPRLPRPLKHPVRSPRNVGATTTLRKKPHMNVGNARAAHRAIHRIKGIRHLLHNIEKHLPRVRHREHPVVRRSR